MELSQQEQVLREVQLIPEDQLAVVYAMLHYFRLGLETTQSRPKEVMRYAGCWQDMPEEVFSGLTNDLSLRRHLAFSRRFARETRTD